MRLDLGCGDKPREDGYTTVDCVAAFNPDVVHDLETFPWPWFNNSIEHIRMIHVLEHLGAEPSVFLRIMEEIHRILVPGGTLEIVVPHPRSDGFIGNYQHVRPINRLMMQQFSRTQGFSPDIYATTGIDMEVVEGRDILMPKWLKAWQDGYITEADIREAANERWNVVNEIWLKMRKVPHA